jgi:threonine synthase
MWGVGAVAATLIAVAKMYEEGVRRRDEESFESLALEDSEVSSPSAVDKLIGRVAISLGEGSTPEVLDISTSEPNDEIHLKLDFLNPTLSYKDRGSSMLVSAARFVGVRKAVVDSSGNAAVSLSAYCARAGISLSVYLPEGTSKSKIAQIKRFGGKVNAIPGDRSSTSDAILEDLERDHPYYMSHIYNPLFHHGTKSFIYELLNSKDGELPDEIVIPAGNGTLLLGIEIALLELSIGGRLRKVPRVIVVQAKNVAPINALLLEKFGVGDTTATKDDLIDASRKQEEIGTVSSPPRYEVVATDVTWIERQKHISSELAPAIRSTNASNEMRFDSTMSSSTLAEGIAIPKPPRLEEMAEVIARRRWPIVVVSEEEIKEARIRLSLQGVDVEDTAAATYAGAIKWIGYRRGPDFNRDDLARGGDGSEVVDLEGIVAGADDSKGNLTVVELTGAGLKSPYSVESN